MIAIYLPLADAETVLARCLDVPGVGAQIQAQLALERLLPTDAVPVMAIWFPDSTHSEHIYDAPLAHRLWTAHTTAMRADATAPSRPASGRRSRSR